jgi:hypothetical protein
MHLLLAVATDLILFPLDLIRRVSRRGGEVATPAALPERTAHPALKSGVLGKEGANAAEAEPAAPTFRSAADVFATGANAAGSTIMYAGTTDAALFQNPTTEFDGVIAPVPYGAMVMAIERRGRFVRVAYAEQVGWMLADTLRACAAEVLPQFTTGAPNGAADDATVRLRDCIADEFGCAAAEMPLTAAEYVHYRLTRRGVRLSWPVGARPRTAGTWHRLLATTSGVTFPDVPERGTILEYTNEDGVGHLAYVESVLPGGTIVISEADYPDSGTYSERTLALAEWHALAPHFIAVAYVRGVE